ncbi:MAG: UDP-N-acetylmuramoyl-tripeptide--D-alanyl-D-alanine ligase, partial [Candidatus Omnitrophica bacterium]|nr:UDP-N-acetylmuramoyl-tripeptide--D-alanyl-D-alanine ligase [Candidatus Omnitrophota bacterium]
QLLRVSPEFQDLSLKIRSLSIDTRTLNPGDLFVAFKGEQCDGHDFLALAFEKGASGALIDLRQKEAAFANLRAAKVPVHNLIPVPDLQVAMTTLAREYRKTLPVKVIGVTGSVGKTTTKEFLFYLLRQKYSALATAGNLNNHLGVPIMLSRLEPSHQYCVLEMGASHPGEIRALAEIAIPSGGILTPIGPAHLEGFGSLENVYNTKLELADSLGKEDPLVVLQNDVRLLEKLSQRGHKAITVGHSEQAEYRITDVKTEGGEVSFLLNGKGRFAFPGQASFLSLNAGLAIAMARSLGLAWEEIPNKWEDVGFASGRFRETILPNGVRVIDDSYNANPVSFGNALAAFQSLPGSGKKIVVFADMLELGAEEERFHAELGEKIAASGVSMALAYGKRTRASIEALKRSKTGCVSRHFEDSLETLAALKEVLRPGDVVLFKGSRSMHVEKVLDGIRNISFLSQT